MRAQLPSDIPLIPLDELVAVQGGCTFKSDDWTTSGVPVVKIANVKDGHIDLSGSSYVSEARAEQADRWSLAPNDILIGMTGYVGTVGRIRQRQLPAVLNQRVGRITVAATDRLNSEYLYRFLRLEETKAAFESLATGSAQPNLGSGHILSIKVPLPPLPVQSRVGDLLRLMDARIELARQVGERLDEVSSVICRGLLSGNTQLVEFALRGSPP